VRRLPPLFLAMARIVLIAQNATASRLCRPLCRRIFVKTQIVPVARIAAASCRTAKGFNTPACCS
jgi:hypothetical protein